MFRKKVPLEETLPLLKNKEEIKKETVEEKLKEDIREEETPVKGSLKKENPVKVLLIYGSELIVMDNQGNGFNIPFTKELKDVKIGDTIYL